MAIEFRTASGRVCHTATHEPTTDRWKAGKAEWVTSFCGVAGWAYRDPGRAPLLPPCKVCDRKYADVQRRRSQELVETWRKK